MTTYLDLLPIHIQQLIFDKVYGLELEEHKKAFVNVLQELTMSIDAHSFNYEGNEEHLFECSICESKMKMWTIKRIINLNGKWCWCCRKAICEKFYANNEYLSFKCSNLCEECYECEKNMYDVSKLGLYCYHLHFRPKAKWWQEEYGAKLNNGFVKVFN